MSLLAIRTVINNYEFDYKNTMKKTFVSLILFTSILVAQANPQGSSTILQDIKKLNTLGSVLYIAAHPDDENTRLLSYLVNEMNLETSYLSLTRGDGGQNLIGKEQGDLLGLIRTQELLEARKIDGAKQYFSRAFDFGYSKNPEETFHFWNKDSVLADVVWVIRKTKPDVIICRFPTTGEGGHGHHTASAILATEAFKAAANPLMFPNQLKYVTTWQAKRIFWNTFNFGGNNTTSEDQLKIDVGGFNALLGVSYGEMAAQSRTKHKSQGFGSASQRGEQIEYFKQLDGNIAKKDLFEGVNQSWARISNTTNVATKIQTCIATFNPLHPEKSIAKLVSIYKDIEHINDKSDDIKFWKNIKLNALSKIIEKCAGLWVETTSLDYIVTPGSNINLKAQVICRNNYKVDLVKIQYNDKHDSTLLLPLTPNKLFNFSTQDAIDEATPYSTPYWLANPHQLGSFNIQDQNNIGLAENKPALSVKFTFNIDGLLLTYSHPVIYKHTDPIKGELVRALEVLPPATINATNELCLFTSNQKQKTSFVIKATKNNVKGVVKILAPKTWNITLKDSLFTLQQKGDEQRIDVEITPSANANDTLLFASLLIDGKLYDKEIRTISYDHITPQFVLSKAQVKIKRLSLNKTFNNIAYIPGAGDDVVECLKQIGFNVTILSNEQLANTDWSRYNAIVTGVRAYNINNELPFLHKKIMNYIYAGGNFIVQYNTNNRISTIPQEIGPYPFEITRDRVTDELAKVNFINPNVEVLNYPNKITDTDFENWIQERGVYFAKDSLDKYQKIFSINDPNEPASKGSLIIAAYGKGNFVYTGLSFFRQLPAGVTGAYRLFTNIICLPTH